MSKRVGICAAENPIMIRICRLKPYPKTVRALSANSGERVAKVSVDLRSASICAGDSSFAKWDLT